MVNIAGLDKATVIQALFNASQPLGMGYLQPHSEPMTREEAEPLVGRYLDYVRGRVMKVKVGHENQFDEWLYDRDNGPGAAQRVIDGLRKDLPVLEPA